MKSVIIGLLSVALFSCSKEKTIFGVYKNEKGEKVFIDCDYRISSDKLEGQVFMPDNGDQITLNTNQMGATEFEMTFKDGNMVNPFGTWDSQSGEITISSVVYTKKEEFSCGK